MTLSKKAEPEELDPLRAAAHAQDVAVREAQAEAAARKKQHQHHAEHARWQVSVQEMMALMDTVGDIQKSAVAAVASNIHAGHMLLPLHHQAAAALEQMCHLAV